MAGKGQEGGGGRFLRINNSISERRFELKLELIQSIQKAGKVGQMSRGAEERGLLVHLLRYGSPGHQLQVAGQHVVSEN